jgi:DNA-binding PadR family transcriptional regulator
MRREDQLNAIEIIDVLPGNYDDIFESLRETRIDITEDSLKSRIRYHLNSLWHAGYIELVLVRKRKKRLYFLTESGEKKFDRVRKNLER